MLKALFKKQMLEMNAWLFQDKKTGKRRSKGGIVGYALLYLFVFGVLFFMFYNVASMLCEPLVRAGMGWLYLSIMGLMAVLLGVFGSVFSTYQSLYRAKDNELLLSLPIRPSHILAVRLFGVWLWGFIYEAFVLVPSLIVYWAAAAPGLRTVAFDILLPLILSVFVLTLSCVLGWVVAKISAKLKHRSIVTVFVSLAFLVAYYYVYFRAYEMLQKLLLNAEAVGESIRGAAYPVYLIGSAGEGNALSLLLLAAMVLALFLLVWAVLSRTFLNIATARSAAAKQRYRETPMKRRTAAGALLRKEAGRFFASPTYMLNCGLGTLLLVAAAVLALIKGAWLRSFIDQFAITANVAPLLICAAICMLAAMNDITAPSVSLEGKALWLVQSLPVSPWQALKAKLELHLLLTAIPALLCSVSACIVLRPGPFAALMMVLLPGLFVLLFAAFGLTINLKMPNLSWTDETVPVKQSMGVLVTLFGGWAFVLLLGALYVLAGSRLTPEWFLLLAAALTGAASGGLLFWLKRRGAVLFAAL